MSQALKVEELIVVKENILFQYFKLTEQLSFSEQPEFLDPDI